MALDEWLIEAPHISRLCQGSSHSGLHGVRNDAREPSEKPSPQGQAVVLEVDEMWHYLKKVPKAVDLEGF
jgi:hypothetical protein